MKHETITDMSKFSHTDEEGKARMVDVSGKPLQYREASATGFIRLQSETVKLIGEDSMKKGNVLTVAQIAGIMAAKKTAELIPLCHPLVLSSVNLSLKLEPDGIRAESMVKCSGQTGVEMEALTAVNIGLLTVYDMCKAVDKTMVIEDIRLIRKIKQDLIEV